MHWGSGQLLFVNRRNADDAKKRVIQINMQKSGAPYLGLQ
jgi:hypothetical protein